MFMFIFVIIQIGLYFIELTTLENLYVKDREQGYFKGVFQCKSYISSTRETVYIEYLDSMAMHT